MKVTIKKFLHRFFLVVAAIFFMSISTFIPAARAFVPSPQFVPAAAEVVKNVVIQQAANPNSANLLRASLSNPLIFVGGLAVGAAWYYWSQSQNEQLQQKASEEFCTVNPSISDCGSGVYQYFFIHPNDCSNPYSNTFFAPNGYRIVPYPTSWSACGVSGGYNIEILDASGRRINSVDGGMQNMPPYPLIRSTDKKPWDEWSDNNKNQALSTVTPDDILPLLQSSSQGGTLKENDELPNGFYLMPPANAPAFIPGPAFVPAEPPPDLSKDTDGDGIPDEEEKKIGTNPNNPDTDGDGLTDNEEKRLGTNPNNPDTDGDGIPDKQETSQGTNPSNLDTDGDGIPDSEDPNPGTNTQSPPLPETQPIQPDKFRGENWLKHGIKVFSNKFPFDIFGSVDIAGNTNECPTYTFFSRPFELCPIRDFIVILKWPVIIAFIIWSYQQI